MGICEKPQHIVMPEKGENIQTFVSHYKQVHVPYIIYTDFEVLSIHTKGATSNPNSSNTRLITKQVLCSYCYVVVHCDGKVKGPILYCGQHVVKRFMESMQVELVKIREILNIQSKCTQMMMTSKPLKSRQVPHLR